MPIMMLQMLIMQVLMLLMLLLLQTLDADIDVYVVPAQVNIGLSPSLDVNCTFSMTASGMAQIISLTVSRVNDTELASITTFSPDQVNVNPNETFSADGVINPGGQSYIHLHWNYPTDTEEGTYQCLARGIDTFGHNIETVNTSVVSVDQIDLQDVLTQLQQLQIHANQLENTLSALEVESQDRVPSPFILPPLEVSGRRYYVSREGFQDFEESIMTCKVHGGILAQMIAPSTYQAVQEYLGNSTGFELLYLGGTDEAEDGTWVMPTNIPGNPIRIEDWYPSSEPKSGDVDNCLTLKSTYNWRMFSSPCHYDSVDPTARFMCQIPEI